VNVKAQALLNAARWVHDTYGPDTLREILDACSPAVRERCASGIAIEWHPLEELTEFLVVLRRVVPDPNVGEEVGAASARVNSRGVMLRLGMLLARPENVLRRAVTMWRQFNDAGELSLVKADEGGVEIVITGIPRTPRVFCDTITGWARELIVSAGGKNAVAKHVECRSTGAARCVWIARWAGMASK
jgi:hypothetical protein